MATQNVVAVNRKPLVTPGFLGPWPGRKGCNRRKPVQSVTVTRFEVMLEHYNLREDRPDLWQFSPHLRRWVQANKGTRYVPEWLLEIWGMEVEDSWG